MKIERTWFAADKTGFHMLHTLFQTSLKFPSIRRFDEFYVTDLLVDDGRCVGAAAIEIRSGRMMAFVARAVIIAMGGAGRVFPFTTNGAIKTGDGMAMAYRAGVPLKDMEFVQYHPTGLPGTGILITEGARGEGGILVNKDGYRYLQDYNLGPPDPWPRKKAMELGPRDRLSQAFWHEQKKRAPSRLRTETSFIWTSAILGKRRSTNGYPWYGNSRRPIAASIPFTRLSRYDPLYTISWAVFTPISKLPLQSQGYSRAVNALAFPLTALIDSAPIL